MGGIAALVRTPPAFAGLLAAVRAVERAGGLRRMFEDRTRRARGAAPVIELERDETGVYRERR